MTTSYTRTRDQIATMVLGKLRVLEPGRTAGSADADICYEAIDLRLKEMHRLGIFWRKVIQVPLTFSLGAAIPTASATADILFPINMTYTNGSMDEPIEIIGARRYADIQDKTVGGVPQMAKWKGGAEFIFWPVPTANGTAKLLYEKIADDTTSGAAIDVDVAMIRWMKDIVAYDIADVYGVPEQRIMRLMKEAEIAEKNIRKLGVEHVDYEAVAVDDFDTYPTSRFRTDWRTG